MRVVVIGSGLMGLVTAYFLVKSGAEVCVVDRQDSAGRETSFANGGMLHASQASPWNAPGILWSALRMLGREDSALLIRKYALPRMLRWGIGFIRNSNPIRYAANIERAGGQRPGNGRQCRDEPRNPHDAISSIRDYGGRGTGPAAVRRYVACRRGSTMVARCG